MRWGLHPRVMVILSLVFLPVIIATGYLPFRNEKEFLATQGRHRAHDLLRSLEILASDALAREDHRNLQAFIQRTFYEEKEVLAMEVLDPAGRPIMTMGPRDLRSGQEPVVLRRRVSTAGRPLGEVALAFDQAPATRSLERTTRLVILSVLDALLCLGFVLHLSLKHLVTRRLEGLTGLSQRLARGELGVTTTDARSDEIGQLTESFNTMSLSLARSRAELESIHRDLEERVAERTERARAEALKREAVVSSLPDGLITFDKDRRVTTINHAAERLLGVTASEVAGRRCDEVIRSPICRTACLHMRARQQTDPVREEEVTFATPAGDVPVSFVSALIHRPDGELEGGVETFRDISQLKAMGENLRHSERLSAIGTLAAGIAHELNNPIGNISTFAQLLRERRDRPAERVERGLDNILAETKRASRIVQQILDFARKATASHGAVVLDDLLEEALTLVGSADPASRMFRSRLDIHGPSRRVIGDRKQLLQVFINLLTNAFQASSPGDEVTVEVGAHPVERDGSSFVDVRVCDHGPGIPEAIRERIFDPFFTTKEVGVGTGLGLTVSYRIIADHRGYLEVESEEGRGTTFHVMLRLADIGCDGTEGTQHPDRG